MPDLDFDGCSSHSCRRPGVHSMAWGLCAHAEKPAPTEATIELLGVFTASDGQQLIGTTSYTVAEMATKVEQALREGGTVPPSGGEYAAMALAVAMMLAGED